MNLFKHLILSIFLIVFNQSSFAEDIKSKLDGKIYSKLNEFTQNIEMLLDRLNIPKSLSEIDVPEDCAERIAKKAMQDQAYATNPKEASLLQMKDIVTQSIKQAR